MMKKYLICLLMVGLLGSMTGCGKQKPEDIPAIQVTEGLSQDAVLEKSGTWPQNARTEGIPRPVGTVLWSMADSTHRTESIAVRGLAKDDVDGYMDRLQAEGFPEIKRAEPSDSGEKPVSFGTLFSDGERTISLSYADPVLMITVSDQGLTNAEGSRLQGSHMMNLYQNSYATYDEADGIGIVTELYVPKSEKTRPALTGLRGVAVVTLPGRQEILPFECSADRIAALGTVLKTGIFGESGEIGTITVSGTAYASNALAGGGSFVSSYSVTLP